MSNPNALQLVAYFDEVEVCNPLAGHAGIHKLGMFIMNIFTKFLVGRKSVATSLPYTCAYILTTLPSVVLSFYYPVKPILHTLSTGKSDTM